METRAVLRVTTLAVVGATMTGCIVLPTPEFHSSEYGTRRTPTSAQLALLTPSVTTREQVLLSMGQPDACWAGERYMLYRWKLVQAVWAAAGYYSASAGTIPKGHMLLLVFDEQGCLRRVEQGKDELFNPISVKKMIRRIEVQPPEKG